MFIYNEYKHGNYFIKAVNDEWKRNIALALSLFNYKEEVIDFLDKWYRTAEDGD